MGKEKLDSPKPKLVKGKYEVAMALSMDEIAGFLDGSGELVQTVLGQMDGA